MRRISSSVSPLAPFAAIESAACTESGEITVAEADFDAADTAAEQVEPERVDRLGESRVRPARWREPSDGAAAAASTPPAGATSGVLRAAGRQSPPG